MLHQAAYNRPSVTLGRFGVRHPAHLMTVTGAFVRRFAAIRGGAREARCVIAADVAEGTHGAFA